MHSQRALITTLGVVIVCLFLMGCTPTAPAEPCMLTANLAVTAYRLPDGASDIFGTVSTGDTFEVLARTTGGWLGFDPGIAQAANIGLARHRWVQLNITLDPSCLPMVDLVTLADVEADLAASGQ